MTINKFKHSLRKFNNKLKKLLKDNTELFVCSIETSDFRGEIEIVFNRVKKELKSCVKIQDTIFNLVKENKDEEARKLALRWVKSFVRLRLDLKDFFIHTRIFLDVLCRIIRIAYRKIGYQLPQSMSDLLKHEKSLQIDGIFFEELRNKMSWYGDFVDEGRDRIVHKLGQLVFTDTSKGGFGFHIKKSFKDKWGPETVKSIEEFILMTFDSLSVLLDFLTENLRFNT